MTSTPATVRHPAVAAAQVPRWTTRLDVSVATGLAAWGVLEVLLTPEMDAVPGLAFVLVSTLPLALRRRFPGAVMTVIATGLVVHASSSAAAATFTPLPSLLLAAFTVAVQVAPLWRAALFGVMPVAAMTAAGLLGYFGAEGAEPRAVAILMFFVGGAWAGGRVVRQRALAALRAEEWSGAAAERAVAAERARIARELHDVVAHAVSVVVLQAGAAEQFIDRDPERARTHIGLARRTAGEAMTEMRHLLDVLREGDPVYVPQPGIERVPELVADAQAAGLAVELVTRGGGPVPDGPSLAAYRIIQESLTNVYKHAPGARTSVEVVVAPDGIRTTVHNDPGHSPAAKHEGGGHGIPGMRERVRVYGGSLEVGPGAGGGWTVRAVVPLEPS